MGNENALEVEDKEKQGESNKKTPTNIHKQYRSIL